MDENRCSFATKWISYAQPISSHVFSSFSNFIGATHESIRFVCESFRGNRRQMITFGVRNDLFIRREFRTELKENRMWLAGSPEHALRICFVSSSPQLCCPLAYAFPITLKCFYGKHRSVTNARNENKPFSQPFYNFTLRAPEYVCVCVPWWIPKTAIPNIRFENKINSVVAFNSPSFGSIFAPGIHILRCQILWYLSPLIVAAAVSAQRSDRSSTGFEW